MKKRREHARCICVLVFINRADQHKSPGCDWASCGLQLLQCTQRCVVTKAGNLGSVSPSLCSWKAWNNVTLKEKLKAAHFPFPGLIYLQEMEMLRKQVECLAEENGKLVGHQNLHQKIQYVVRLKKENIRLAEVNSWKLCRINSFWFLNDDLVKI